MTNNKYCFNPIPTLCKCGCNEIVWNGRCWIKGHQNKNRIPWNKGKEWSEEIKEKISQSNKDHIPWNKGMKYNEYWKDKIFNSDTQIYAWSTGLTKETSKSVNKISEAHIGKKFSKDHKEKISEAKKNFYKDNPEEKLKAAKYGLKGLQSQRRKISSLEILLHEALERQNIPFSTQFKIDRYCVDILVEDCICCEADGKYWHSLDWVKIKDKKRDAIIKKEGYLVERFNEDEIRESADNCIKKLINKYPHLKQYKKS